MTQKETIPVLLGRVAKRGLHLSVLHLKVVGILCLTQVSGAAGGARAGFKGQQDSEQGCPTPPSRSPLVGLMCVVGWWVVYVCGMSMDR